MLPQAARPFPALLALLLAASLPAAQEEGPAVHDLAPHAGAARLALSPPVRRPDTRKGTAPAKVVPVPRTGRPDREAAPVVTASATAPGSSPGGAHDGDRFSADPAKSWRGRAGEKSWWWQLDFGRPRAVGAVLQVNGDDAEILRNAPRRYVWQASDDGRAWADLPATAEADERRLFRLHRLPRTVTARSTQR